MWGMCLMQFNWTFQKNIYEIPAQVLCGFMGFSLIIFMFIFCLASETWPTATTQNVTMGQIEVYDAAAVTIDPRI
jgi:uncharacterized membrane protein YagU involved in acid resistance